MSELVVCSLEAWDEVWRRNQYLVAGLIDREPDLRVLFVEPPEDPLHAIASRRLPSLGRGLARREDVGGGRLWTHQPTKWLPRAAGSLADHPLTGGLLRAVRRLGFDRPVLWVNDPSRAALLARVDWPLVYDITDDWLAADRPAREIARLTANERLLMSRAEAVLVCSPELARRKNAARQVDLVPNAVDLRRYRRPYTRPSDLPSGAVAVYVGTLHEDRLDVDLCVRTAEVIDGIGHLVFVGPDALNAANSARLRSAAGVVVLGARASETVPAYLQHAGLLFVPHVVTSFTESLDPIKLYEYLAVGRPIVSTPVAGFRTATGPITIGVDSAFVDAVRAGLTAWTVGPSSPAEFAPVPSWAERVERVRAILDVVRSADNLPERN